MTEHSRRFPDKAFSHSPERSSPVITFHFAAMKCFGSPCDLVQPRLRNLLTGFAGFKTLNKFPNQAGAILYWQQQNLLTQLFQCHRCAFRSDSCIVLPHSGCAACGKSMSPTCEWEAFKNLKTHSKCFNRMALVYFTRVGLRLRSASGRRESPDFCSVHAVNQGIDIPRSPT